MAQNIKRIKKFVHTFSAEWSEQNFSSREFDILTCLLRGKSSKKIAALLSIQSKTVDTHILNITHKLGLHSRVELIGLTERYGDAEALCANYEKLLRARNFREAVQKSAGHVRMQHIVCRVICQNSALLQKMTFNLKKAGIRIAEPDETLIDGATIKTIFIILSSDELLQKTEALSESAFFIYAGNDEGLFFDILYNLCPSAWIKETRTYFNSVVITARQPHDLFMAQGVHFPRSWLPALYTLLGFCLLFLCGIFYMKTANNISKHYDVTSVHSVFAIPDDTHRLNRQHLMTKIATSFDKDNGIQTVILVGIGGSGKTTLARQYASLKRYPIVWELNAETKESLIESFEHLAYAISKTEDEKAELTRIRSMTNESEKKKFLILIVQRHFRNIKKPWCLIFDNVEKFTDIQECFPKNTAAWGRGQVLITTQNEHIVNNSQLGSRTIVHVEAFSDQERFSFFAKLVFGAENPVLTPAEKQEIIQFLKHIPPYPLDISLAAHDITVNHLTYQQCIERQKSTDLEFEKMSDQFFAADVSDYKKTRYSTIVTNMKSLIQICPNFQNLFFMIALIGSQHIPKDLLLTCQDQKTVDLFIDHMKKLSFMTHDQGKYQKKDSDSNTLSIHRSTQDIMLTYFERFLDKKERDKSAVSVIEALERYTNPLIAEMNIPKARGVLNHLLIALKHQSALPSLARGILNLQLGRIYYCLNDLKNASLFSERSLQDLQVHYQKTVHIRLARALACFGITNKMIANDYGNGMRCLERSLELYERHFSNNREELAWVLLQLGNTYVIIDDNKKAADVLRRGMAIYAAHYSADYPKVAWGLLYQGDVARLSGDYANAEQFYKKSRKLFEKKYGAEYPKTMWADIRLAMTYMLAGKLIEAKNLLEALPLTYEKQATENHDNVIWQTFCLGEIYRQLGCYQKAKQLLDQSFQVCTGYYSEVCRAWWPSLHLGRLYIDLGDYAAAEKLFEKSFDIQKKHIGANHIRTIWASHQLANVYTKTGRFDAAKPLFTHVLTHYKKHYGAHHLECAHLLCDIGQFYLLQNDHERGKSVIDEACCIFTAHNHPELYRCYEVLGNFYLARHEAQKERSELIEPALYNLKAALAITQSRFPNNSVYTARIIRKIEKLEIGLDGKKQDLLFK